jgi:hypothetical protein
VKKEYVMNAFIDDYAMKVLFVRWVVFSGENEKPRPEAWFGIR